jgi:hypothetical protein
MSLFEFTVDERFPNNQEELYPLRFDDDNTDEGI